MCHAAVWWVPACAGAQPAVLPNHDTTAAAARRDCCIKVAAPTTFVLAPTEKLPQPSGRMSSAVLLRHATLAAKLCLSPIGSAADLQCSAAQLRPLCAGLLHKLVNGEFLLEWLCHQLCCLFIHLLWYNSVQGCKAAMSCHCLSWLPAVEAGTVVFDCDH